MAKSHGTSGRRCIRSGENKKPMTIPEGVSTGISRSRRRFRAEAMSAGFCESMTHYKEKIRKRKECNALAAVPHGFD
jgi:hypothetical protein